MDNGCSSKRFCCYLFNTWFQLTNDLFNRIKLSAKIKLKRVEPCVALKLKPTIKNYKKGLCEMNK
jgi:hypothetical protein